MTLQAFGIHRTVEKLSELPIVFDLLRWLLEAGFGQHRRLIKRAFPEPPMRILDCGCGTGIYASCFTPETYMGVDISSNYIDHARRNNPSYSFDVMDATSLAFADSTFEAVIVSGVIHHLPDKQSQAMLSEIWRVLRSGGKLLLWEDVQARSPLNLIGRLVHSLDVGDYIRDEEGYQAMITPCFEIERIEGIRSGFMDYVAFTARKKSQPRNSISPILKVIADQSALESPFMKTSELGRSS